jgi:hypothetical protein
MAHGDHDNEVAGFDPVHEDTKLLGQRLDLSGIRALGTFNILHPVERTNSWLSSFSLLRRNTDRFVHTPPGPVRPFRGPDPHHQLVKWAKRRQFLAVARWGAL